MGNCKSCLKPRTSDDLERPSHQSIGAQGPSGADGGLDGRAVSSSAGRLPSATSRRSKNGSSISIKPAVTTASPPSHSCQIQEVPPPLNEDSSLQDVSRRIPSAAKQRIHASGSALRKENVIWVRPAAGSDDVYANDGRNLMNKLKTQYPINSIKDICFILWEKDDRLVHNKDYKFSRNKGLQVYLKDSFYASHPTFNALRELLTTYTKKDMNARNRRESAENKFLDEVMEKEVLQICWAYLNHAGYYSFDRNTFRDALRHIWFPLAFQHIFAGIEGGRVSGVSGLHNWLQFSLEKENIEYQECLRQISEIMVHIKFRWNGATKDNGSMFLGTTPEFELALYTLLFFEVLSESNNSSNEGNYELNLGGRHINDDPNISVQVVVDNTSNENYRKFLNTNKILKTAYPIKLKRSK